MNITFCLTLWGVIRKEEAFHDDNADAVIKDKVRQKSIGNGLSTWNPTWFGLYPYSSNNAHGSLRPLPANTLQ